MYPVQLLLILPGVDQSPFIVTGNVLVASGVTLTIEAGVTVKVSSSAIIQNNWNINSYRNVF